MEESRLENVPIEIQLNIVYHLPDIASLYTLVHASSRYHTTYLPARGFVLSQVLARELGPYALFDAGKTAEALTLPKKHEDDGEQLRHFLNKYKDSVPHYYTTDKVDKLQLDFLVLMAQLQSTVRFVAQGFLGSALSHRSVKNKIIDEPKPISHRELERIYRAFYRFEFFLPSLPSAPLCTFATIC